MQFLPGAPMSKHCKCCAKRDLDHPLGDATHQVQRLRQLLLAAREFINGDLMLTEEQNARFVRMINMALSDGERFDAKIIAAREEV